MPGESGGGKARRARPGGWGRSLQRDEEDRRLGGDLGSADETSANAAQRVGHCRREQDGGEEDREHKRHYLTDRAQGSSSLRATRVVGEGRREGGYKPGRE